MYAAYRVLTQCVSVLLLYVHTHTHTRTHTPCVGVPLIGWRTPFITLVLPHGRLGGMDLLLLLKENLRDIL